MTGSGDRGGDQPPPGYRPFERDYYASASADTTAPTPQELAKRAEDAEWIERAKQRRNERRRTGKQIKAVVMTELHRRADPAGFRAGRPDPRGVA